MKDNFKWPVRYKEHPDIWEAWEVLREGDFRYNWSVPPRPLGQLIVTREKNFYPQDGNTYFNEGYKYYWVNYGSKEWEELTPNEFKDKHLDFKYLRDGRGRPKYICNLAYSAIKPPEYPRNYTYKDYTNYLRSYYPDYMADDVLEVYVLWTKDGRPVVQIRVKCGNKWDMVYPGDQDYVPLWRFYWRDLENFGRDFGKVEKIFPQEILFTPKKAYYIPEGYNIQNVLNGDSRRRVFPRIGGPID